MMGVPKEQLSTEYGFPRYNNVHTTAVDQGSRIANVDTNRQPVEVWVGNTKLHTNSLGGGASIRKNYNVNKGPIRIVCTTCNINNVADRIITALRVIWQEPGPRFSYSEMMGLPKEQLSTEYWFPWYNNLDIPSMDQGFRIANVDTTTHTVEVWVGNTKLDTISLGGGASIRKNYNVNNGPIRIVCTTCNSINANDRIIAALRVIWREPGVRTSYSEMMGIPKEQLSTEYWFPWYNNVDTTAMDQGFRIANVDTTTHTVKLWVVNTQLNPI